MTTILWNGKHLAADTRKTLLDATTMQPVSYSDGEVRKIYTSCFLSYYGRKVQAYGVAGNSTLLDTFKSIANMGFLDLGDEEIWGNLCEAVNMLSQILLVVEDRIVVVNFKPVEDGMIEWQVFDKPREDWFVVGSGANVLTEKMKDMSEADLQEMEHAIRTKDIFQSMAIFQFIDAFTGGPTDCWDGEKVVREDRYSTRTGQDQEIVAFCTDLVGKRFDFSQFQHLMGIYVNHVPTREQTLESLELKDYELI